MDGLSLLPSDRNSSSKCVLWCLQSPASRCCTWHKRAQRVEAELDRHWVHHGMYRSARPAILDAAHVKVRSVLFLSPEQATVAKRLRQSESRV